MPAVGSFGNINVPGQQPVASSNGAVQRAVPFVRAAYKARLAGPPQSVVLGAAVQNMSIVIPTVGGWNRRIGLQVVCTTAANAAAVTFAADGPFNVCTQILLSDAARKQLILWTNGYYGYLANNFGGYKTFKMDASTRGYSVTTGAVGAGGSFTFDMLLPQECARDGICSYPNMDSSQRLTVDLTINANANIYGVAPTNPGTLVVTPIVYYYTKPAAANAANAAQETVPPGAGSVQFWRTQSFVLSSGNNLVPVQLSGRYIRNILAIFTDGSDVRSDTVRPTSVRAELDNNLIFDSTTLDWDADIYRTFGIDTPTGLIPLLLGTTDPDGIGGNEWGDDWWYTTTSSQLTLKFSAGAAGKLYLLLNEVEAQGDIFR